MMACSGMTGTAQYLIDLVRLGGHMTMDCEDEHSELRAHNTSSTKSVSPRKPANFFRERPPQVMEVVPQLLRRRTRRDFLLFGMGTIAAVAGGGSLLPQTTLERLGLIHGKKNLPKKE